MGSLSSTPKAPQRQKQQVIYTVAPRAISTPTPVKAPPKENASKIREETLLARKRGRLGTVATSLNGFLGETNSVARKTLLGE